MLGWITKKLFATKTPQAEVSEPPVPVQMTPQEGAAGVLIEMVHRDGAYTEVERDIVVQAMMRMFRCDRAEADKLRQRAEDKQRQEVTMMRFGVAARGLTAEEKEALVTYCWAILDSDGEASVPETQLLHSVSDVIGLPLDRVAALRRGSDGLLSAKEG